MGLLASTVLLLLFLTFVIQRNSPIDPLIRVLGDHASKEAYQAASADLGLNKPLLLQFGDYLVRLGKGDLGQATSTGRGVMEDLQYYFPATLELATVAIVLGIVLGVPLGIWAAHRHNRFTDQAIRVLTLLGYSVPIFWLGLMSLLVFYARLHWAAGPGRLDDAWKYTLTTHTNLLLIDTLWEGNLDAFVNAVAHLALPALLLAYLSLAYIARMTRTFALEELGKEYVLFARIKGASEARVLWRHVLPNIAAPLVTVIALSYAHLLEGAVLTESVFSWPGIGLYITNALFAADFQAVLGGTLLVGVVFIALNTFSDFLGSWFDPRAR